MLLQLDNLEELHQLTVPEGNFRKILNAHILRLLKYQNAYWRKHCTFRYANQGEENTKYFHARATEKYSRNTIPTVQLEDGRVVDTHHEKATAFRTYFKNRMRVSNEPVFDFELADLFQRVLELEELSTPFSQAKIDNVIKLIPMVRAPAPDGFNRQFLKVCWNIIAPDFYQLCADFWEGKISL